MALNVGMPDAPKGPTRNEFTGFKLLRFSGWGAGCRRSAAMPRRFRWFSRSPWRGAIPVLDIGGVDHGADQQSISIGNDMALASLDQLGRIEAPDAEQKLVADEEYEILLIQPADTVNTGDAGGEVTRFPTATRWGHRKGLVVSIHLS